MKKWLSIFIVVVQSMFLTGCWDRVEINDIAIVTGLAIDKKNKNTIELTAEIQIPKASSGGGGGGGGGGHGNPNFERSGEGTTIADAISNLQEKLPREVFWGQTKVIVIGDKLAKEGIRVPLDFLMRHPQPRLRARVFVADGKAKDMLAVHPPLERNPSEVLRELAKSEILMDVTLKKLLQELSEDTQGVAIPMVRILPPKQGTDPLQTIAYIHQTAVFKKDKMVGEINDKLTRGVLWLRNEMKQANVSIHLKKEKEFIATRMYRSRSELIPKIEDGKWRMTVKVVTEHNAIVNGSHLSLMSPKIIQWTQKELEKEIRDRINLTLKKVQKEQKVDILGFSEEFHRKYPKEWKTAKKDWDKIFPSVEVTLDVKAYIRRPGLNTEPPGVQENEVKKK